MTDTSYESLMQFLYRAPIGLVQMTQAGDVVMINPKAAQLLMPLSPDGTLDNFFSALAEVAPELPMGAEGSDLSDGVLCEALRIPLRNSGRGGPETLSVSLLRLDDRHLMAVVADVTAEVRREQQGLSRELDAAARADRLTNMPNRVVMIERITEALRPSPESGGEFALLCINCDRFRLINDAFGRSIGDELLKLVADRVRSILRSRDRDHQGPADESLAARTGGDEFAVLLGDVKVPDHARSVAQRLVEQLIKPYTIDDHQIYCRVSVGIVLQRDAARDADAVLQDASLAVAESKATGGARFTLFEPGMRQRAERRGSIEADLRHAVRENQLLVVYQPVVGLKNGGAAATAVDRTAGVEALVRWRHPTRGMVSPVEFIGIAEECGLIGELGEFVLRTACVQFAQWHKTLGRSAPKTLAVNLSRAQLSQSDLVSVVADALRSTGVSATQLQLEVTESFAAQDERALTRLHELKRLGLTLALDDFGTGYSSLSSLHQIPVDTVKIDRSFVIQADTSKHHRVLIEATIRVAHSLGMTTVAEGVETESQAEQIRRLGSDKGQGYLFSKPLFAPELADWLRAGDTVS